MVLFLKNVFRPNYEVFLAQNQETLNVGKVRNYDEERVLFREKKRFHLSKSLLYKNGKAQNMPVVAGRLLFLVFKRLLGSADDSEFEIFYHRIANCSKFAVE